MAARSAASLNAPWPAADAPWAAFRSDSVGAVVQGGNGVLVSAARAPAELSEMIPATRQLPRGKRISTLQPFILSTARVPSASANVPKLTPFRTLFSR